VVLRLAPAVVQILMPGQITMLVQALSSATRRSADLFFRAGVLVLILVWTMTMSAMHLT
jgi:hypothetical protein